MTFRYNYTTCEPLEIKSFNEMLIVLKRKTSLFFFRYDTQTQQASHKIAIKDFGQQKTKETRFRQSQLVICLISVTFIRQMIVVVSAKEH